MFKKQAKCCDCGFLAITPPEEISVAKPMALNDMPYYNEFTQMGRGRLKDGAHLNPYLLTCTRHVWSGSLIKKKRKANVLNDLSSARKCLFFFPYSPGYEPHQHLELQRERTQHRILLIASLLSAGVGAGIATLVNLLW